MSIQPIHLNFFENCFSSKKDVALYITKFKSLLKGAFVLRFIEFGYVVPERKENIC